MEHDRLLRTSNCLEIDSQKRYFSLSLPRNSSSCLLVEHCLQNHRTKKKSYQFWIFVFHHSNGKQMPIAFFPHRSLAEMQLSSKKENCIASEIKTRFLPSFSFTDRFQSKKCLATGSQLCSNCKWMHDGADLLIQWIESMWLIECGLVIDDWFGIGIW